MRVLTAPVGWVERRATAVSLRRMFTFRMAGDGEPSRCDVTARECYLLGSPAVQQARASWQFVSLTRIL